MPNTRQRRRDRRRGKLARDAAPTAASAARDARAGHAGIARSADRAPPATRAVASPASSVGTRPASSAGIQSGRVSAYCHASSASCSASWTRRGPARSPPLRRGREIRARPAGSRATNVAVGEHRRDRGGELRRSIASSRHSHRPTSRSTNRSNVTSSSPAAIPRASAISRDSQRADEVAADDDRRRRERIGRRQCLEQRAEERLGAVAMDRAQHRLRMHARRAADHPQRAGHELEPRRQPPGRLAVDVELDHRRPARSARPRRRFARRALTLSIAEVRALVEPAPARQQIAEREVAHRDDVERAVVDLGVRRDHHRAAEVAAVRDRDGVDRGLDAILAVEHELRRAGSCTTTSRARWRA